MNRLFLGSDLGRRAERRKLCVREKRAHELGLNWSSPFFGDLMRRYLQTVADRRDAEIGAAIA